MTVGFLVCGLPVLYGSISNSSTGALSVKGENLIFFLFLVIKDWRLTPWKSWKNINSSYVQPSVTFPPSLLQSYSQ